MDAVGHPFPQFLSNPKHTSSSHALTFTGRVLSVCHTNLSWIDMNTNIPATPYDTARFISVRVDPLFHKELRAFSVEKDASVSAVVVAAIAKYMQGK